MFVVFDRTALGAKYIIAFLNIFYGLSKPICNFGIVVGKPEQQMSKNIWALMYHPMFYQCLDNSIYGKDNFRIYMVYLDSKKAQALSLMFG